MYIPLHDYQLNSYPVTEPTYGDASVWAHKVDIRLRDGPHSDLVERSRQECCERADKCDRAIPCRRTNGYTSQVLLSDVTLNEPLGEGVLDQT